MTTQQYDDLYDDAHRLDPTVVEAMAERAADADHNTTPWVVEYEVPAETNGWIYMGNPGAVSVTHLWVDDVPVYTVAVELHYTSTHPRDETPDVIEVCHVAEPGNSVGEQERTTIYKADGKPYRTPLHVRRRMFWEAVEAAIEWMEENPP